MLLDCCFQATSSFIPQLTAVSGPLLRGRLHGVLETRLLALLWGHHCPERVWACSGAAHLAHPSIPALPHLCDTLRYHCSLFPTSGALLTKMPPHKLHSVTSYFLPLWGHWFLRFVVSALFWDLGSKGPSAWRKSKANGNPPTVVPQGWGQEAGFSSRPRTWAQRTGGGCCPGISPLFIFFLPSFLSFFFPFTFWPHQSACGIFPNQR